MAWEMVKAKRGSGGVDGQSPDGFAAQPDQQLDRLQSELKEDGYRPQPVRQVQIPKAGKPGEFRTLGIPTIYDRVCQQALLNRLEPIFEPVFDEANFGYRDHAQGVEGDSERPGVDRGRRLEGLFRVGYYQYHGVPGNLSVLKRFRRQVARYWFHALGQRSQRQPTWEKLGILFDQWLPVPKVVHEFPDARFHASRRAAANPK